MIKPKIKLLAALLALAVSGPRTGRAQQTNDEVTLEVTLVAIQNISVTSGQETVSFTFNDVTDYQDGITTLKTDHLNVCSTTGFKVVVSADADLDNGTDQIDIGTIAITPTVNTEYTAPGGHSISPVANLSITDQDLITSVTNGTTEIHYDVNYTALGGDDYVNISTTAVYTATVTYTISAL